MQPIFVCWIFSYSCLKTLTVLFYALAALCGTLTIIDIAIPLYYNNNYVNTKIRKPSSF